MNKSEKFIQTKYEKEGFKSLKNSHPDFIFYKEINNQIKEVLFVEVKQDEDVLKPEQLEYKKVIEGIGLKFILEKVNSFEIKDREFKEKKKEEMLNLLKEYKKLSLTKLSKLLGKNKQFVLDLVYSASNLSINDFSGYKWIFLKN